MDIPRPKLPKALAPKSLRGATVSDLGEEHASLLGEVIKELDFPEAEISEDRNLSFLSELWLSEKMKGRGANREAMAKIEAIAISAASPFAHRVHPSHKDGGGSEGAGGMKQSPGGARRVWERAKLGTAETISRVAWGSKTDYRMALQRLGLDENAKNVLSLGRYEKAYRQNVAKRYDWQGLFNPLLACQNAIRNDNDLAAASKALVSRFKAKPGIGKLEIIETFRACQNAINSPADIAPAWDEIARNCKEFSRFRHNDGRKVFEDSARFANSPGDLAEIFSAYADLRNAGAGVDEYNYSDYLPRVSTAFIGGVSSKSELLDWLGIATACVKDTVEIKNSFSSNELSDLKRDLQKIMAIARNHEQLHEMRLLFEEIHSLTASSRKKAEAENTRDSKRIYIPPETSLAAGAMELSSWLFSKPEMIREIARLVRQLSPEVETSDAISLLGAISPALKKPSDIAQAADCVLRLHKLWQADLGSDGKPERLTYDGYFNSFRETFSRADTLGKARHAIGIIESALAKGEMLFSTDPANVHGSEIKNKFSGETYNIGSAADGIFWHNGFRARIEKTNDSFSIYRILTLRGDFVYQYRKALPAMGNAKDGRSAWEIFEGLDLRKNSTSEDEKNPVIIALTKGVFKSADELAQFETLVCEYEKRHPGWKNAAKIVTEISEAGHVKTLEDFRMVLQGRELLKAIGAGEGWGFLRSLEGASFKSAKECLLFCESFAAASQKSFVHRQAAMFVMLQWNDLSQSAFFGKDPCSCIDKMAAPFLHSLGVFRADGKEGAKSALSGYLGGMQLSNWEEAAAGAMRNGEAALVCRPNNMDGDYRLPLRKKGNGVELFWADYKSRDFLHRSEQFRGFVSSAIKEGSIKDGDGLVSFIKNVELLKSTIVDSYSKWKNDKDAILPESQLAFQLRAAKSFEKLLPGAREEFFSALLDTLLPIAASKAKEAKTPEGMLEYGNRLFEAYAACAITCPLGEFSDLTKQLAEKGALASLSDFDSYAAVLGKVAKAVGGDGSVASVDNPSNAWGVLPSLTPRIKNAESVSEFGDYFEKIVLSFNSCEGKLKPGEYVSLTQHLDTARWFDTPEKFADYGLALARLAKSYPDFIRNIPYLNQDGVLPDKSLSAIEALAPFAERIMAARGEAEEIPETGFFFENEKPLRLLFRHPKSTCALLDRQFHPVVALALASLDKEWSNEEILALGRIIPKNGEINKEKYVRPVFVSFIDANPKLQLGILSHVLAQGIASRDDQKMLQLMSFAHSLGEPFREFFTKAEFSSMDDALLKAKAAAVGLLSQKYPRAEIERMPERDLARWLSVFPEFEQTMKIHHDENLIPALRALATIELLGEEREFALHDEKLEAYLEKNAERLFPEEGMRPKIMEYIAKWRAMEDEKALFPGKSRKQAVAKLAEWKRPLRVEHVLEEISIVDRLEEAEKNLDSVFVKNHFCAEFVKVAGLYDGAATMRELADEYRRLKAKGAGRQGLEAVVGRQNEIKRWSKLQSIFLNYENGFEEARNGIAQAGRGLAPFETTLKDWGFDYGDSFGNKVFLGELMMLARRCESELKASPNDARLLELSGKISEFEKACSKGNDYVLSIAELLSPADGGKKGILAELYEKRDWAQGLLGEMEKEGLGFEAALLRVEKEQLQLYGIIKGTEGLDRQKLQDALLRYTDLTAITDLEAIAATARSEGSQKSQVFVYANQPLFSKVELAMVGQCLDYRYSKNSIGNAPFTVSYMDPWRQLLVAYPQTDEEMEHPKVNGIVFLAGVSLEGKQETAVVMDTIWTSDKTDLGWSKVEGQVKFALQKALDVGMPLVVPDFLSTYFDNIRELAATMGFGAKESEAKVTVMPGPAGATYCELKGYDHYEKNTELDVTSLVLRAANR